MTDRLLKKTNHSVALYRELGGLIAIYRVKSGLSAKELAERIPFETEEDILRYEQGASPPPLDTIMALSNELNIPPAEIIELLLNLFSLKS